MLRIIVVMAALIAWQTGETPRRVRARLEKQGQMDALRNQIIERKAIELIMSKATIKDVEYKLEEGDAEALDQRQLGHARAGLVLARQEQLAEPQQSAHGLRLGFGLHAHGPTIAIHRAPLQPD